MPWGKALYPRQETEDSRGPGVGNIQGYAKNLLFMSKGF